MSVYFVTARQVDLVKIGCASDPFRRLDYLQTSSPVELTLEAIYPGAYDRERELHARFAQLRVRGEWFKLDAEIELMIVTAGPPKRPVSEADKRRLGRMHKTDKWAARWREDDERRLAQADIHFPFRQRDQAA
jgi:hypothetical protein